MLGVRALHAVVLRQQKVARLFSFSAQVLIEFSASAFAHSEIPIEVCNSRVADSQVPIDVSYSKFAYFKRRCKTCHEKQRRRRRCTDCGADPACTELYRGRHRCEDCLRQARLRLAGDYRANTSAEAGELAALAARMLACALLLISLWILPIEECLYVKIRCILFEVFGHFCGLLPGPPPGTFTRGRALYSANPAAYAEFLMSLVNAGLWPPAGSKVLCCGFTTAKLASVQALLPFDIAAQLIPFPLSLSSRSGPRTQVPLEEKARSVVEIVGLEARPGVALTSRQAAMFRDFVYP